MRLPAAALALLVALPLAARAQEKPAGSDSIPPQSFDWHAQDPIAAVTPWGQAVDTASSRRIRSWTTMREYTNPLVDHLPDDPAVVSPTEHFGYPIGKPGVLHRVDEIYGYFEALAASSPRVRFQLLGETEEGNRLALAQVGSEANLARLEEVRAGLNALSDPRGTDEAEARRLIERLPVVYTLYAGLHSPETGPPEMVMELAYRLAVSDHPMIRTIRDSVVVFIVPVAEPDGRNRVVDWVRRYGKDVFSEDDRVPGPPYWGKYIFHDNNRDGLQLSARLTQELVKLFLDWRYPVGHDLHESIPYLYTSTGTGPYNPTVDPITVSEWQWLSNYEVTALTALGMPGVWTHGFYDGWYPGYLLWVTNTRNAVGRFYETFGNMVPNTMKRELSDRQTRVEWYRPNPPREETLWSLRNNTNYMQTGVLHALDLVARNRARLLEQYWTKANNSLRKGRTEKPFAWVIPAAQERRADAAYMLDLLRRQGIELHRATAEAAFRKVEVKAGDYVVRMDQPFRNFVRTLMEVQKFPADAPTPYDDVAWTFPLMFNVTAHAVEDSAVLAHAMEPVTGAVELPGSLEVVGDGAPAWYVVRPAASAHAIRARLALGDVPVHAAEAAIELGAAEDDVVAAAGGASEEKAAPAAAGEGKDAGEAATGAAPAGEKAAPAGTGAEGGQPDEEGDGASPAAPAPRTIPPGAWLIEASRVAAPRMEAWAREHGLEVVAVPADAVEGVPRHAMDMPRVALLHTWRSTQNDGWVRYAFDRMGLPYTYIGEDRIAGMDLRRRFDVIVMASQGSRSSAKAIFQGIDPEHSPMPYTRTREFPSHGFPDSSDDITGGMGYEGLAALRDFIHDGGTFIALGSASTLPVDFGLVRDVSLATPRSLFVPGSIVKGKTAQPRHPLAYGYGDGMPLYHQFGPYFVLPDRMEKHAVVEYAPAKEVFLSGLVRGPEELGGRPAVVSVPVGEGHVVLFGFNPLHRFQSHGDFAFVWNALMNWNDLGVGFEEKDDDEE